MIQLIIKGTPREAIHSCEKRGITTQFVEQIRTFPAQSVLKVDDEYLQAITRWFCETTYEDCIPGEGYPIGSLLHYTHF